ncbi:unnamed protein product [Caenorhabditis brenneri]
MYSLFFFVTFLASFGSTVLVPDECKLPLDMGKTPCKGGKKEIRYHFDEKSFMPLSFEYTGCGGNKNNFKSEGECRIVCTAYDYTGCPAGSEPLKSPCETDKDCGPKGVCQYGNHFNMCCDKQITAKFNADFEPKCPKGKKVLKIEVGGIPSTVVGKSCKSKFCPTGATCVEGTYFATCCK